MQSHYGSVSQHDELIVRCVNKGAVDLPDERILGPLGLASIMFFEVTCLYGDRPVSEQTNL